MLVTLPKEAWDTGEARGRVLMMHVLLISSIDTILTKEILLSQSHLPLRVHALGETSLSKLGAAKRSSKSL